MNSKRRLHYLIAAICAVMAVGLNLVLHALVGEEVPILFFSAAVMVAGWFGGFGPGVIATLLSAGGWYFALPETRNLPIEQMPGQLLQLILFLPEGVFISILCEQFHRSRGAAEAGLRGERAAIQHFSALNRATYDAVWDWDIKTGVTYWNAGICDIFGYRATAEKLASDWWSGKIHPADRERVMASIHGALKSSVTSWCEEYRFLRDDGSYAEVMDRGNVVRDKTGSAERMIGVMIDLTQVKKSTAALAERTRLARMNAAVSGAVIESGDVPTILRHVCEIAVENLDAALARVWALEKCGEVLELCASAGIYTDVNGHDFRVPVGHSYIGRIAGERQPHLTNEVSAESEGSDFQWARDFGMVAFAGFPLIVEERIVGVLAVFARHPLSDAEFSALGAVSQSVASGIVRKRVEDERVTILESERSARSAAERANRAKDEFLATVSHELRTPLNAILGWTQILRNHEDATVVAEGLKVIERNARAQAQLIEDILDVSRIISGQVRLHCELVELAPIIQAALASARPAAQARDLELHAELDPQAGLVSCDSARIQQIAWNLISNAVKFTPKGGRVNVSLKRVDSSIELKVSDSGQGIAAEFLPFVFDRFQQADSTSTRSHSGLGLGLAIVRHLVELHGGTVAVASPGVNRGATFTVSFPARTVSVSFSSSEGPQLTGECELKGWRVLVVDDELDARDVLRRLLTLNGAEVRACASAHEGIEELGQWVPDVIISDVGMPGEDGYSFIGRVRALPALTGGLVPAIALTAYARMEDRTRALEAGFQMHIAKPIEGAVLIASVATLANLARPRAIN